MTPATAEPGVRRLELPLPAEPVALRAETLALVDRSPAEAEALIGAGEWIAGTLWSHWGGALREAGMPRASLVRIAADYRQELWLWLVGERTWAQCASGLRGRVLRRVNR